jgi:hypothetical protein
MSSSPERQSPKTNFDPPKEQIKLGGDPDAFEKQTIAWHFHRLDRLHTEWGWDKLSAKQWKLMLQHLVSLEGLTWAALKAQAGGRKQGTNHHSLAVAGFTKSARDRLKELKLDDYDTIFSMRLSNTLRIYGIRDGRVLQLVWHDPHHGSKNGCYPTKS